MLLGPALRQATAPYQLCAPSHTSAHATGARAAGGGAPGDIRHAGRHARVLRGRQRGGAARVGERPGRRGLRLRAAWAGSFGALQQRTVWRAGCCPVQALRPTCRLACPAAGALHAGGGPAAGGGAAQLRAPLAAGAEPPGQRRQEAAGAASLQARQPSRRLRSPASRPRPASALLAGPCQSLRCPER
jgi:hypothetical protein